MGAAVRPRTTPPSSWLGPAASWLAQQGWRGEGAGVGPGQAGPGRAASASSARSVEGTALPVGPPTPTRTAWSGPHNCAEWPGSRAQQAWAALGPGDPATRRRLAGVAGVAGGPVPSDTAEFSSVCVPFRERLTLRRASRGDFLYELSSRTGRAQIRGNCYCGSSL